MISGRKKTKFYGSLALLLLVSLVFPLSAQIKAKIENYSTEDGLSHDGVMAMIKDHEGFMWFATWDGINRFDGHNFITYKSRPGDRSNLKNNRIQNIVEDKSGYLWLRAYDKQLYRFDKKTEKYFSVSELLPETHKRDVSFDKIIPYDKGTVWLTTKKQGVFCVLDLQTQHPRIVRYSADATNNFRLASDRIIFFHEDQQHRFWVGTDKGLSCLERDKSGVYKNISLKSGLAKGFDYTGIAENKQRIWLSTKQGYMVSYDQLTKEVVTKKISNNSLNTVFLSHRRNIAYFSTSAFEIITLNLEDLQTSTAVMANAKESFLSIYEDKAGLLWIEPEKNGVIKYDPLRRTFKYYLQKVDATYDLPPENYSVFEDNKDLVWICMKGGGFGYYNDATDAVDYFYDQPGSPTRAFSNLVTCKYFDSAGVLWISANDRGLHKIIFQRDDFNHKLLVENTLNKSDNDIRSVFNDHKNRLWLAAKVGKLYIYDDKGKPLDKLFVNEPKNGLGFIYTIIEDKNNVVWLGTKGDGLFKAEPINQQATQYRLTHFVADEQDKYSLSSNLIYSVLEDKKGRIWVGTYGQGLNQVIVKNGKTEFLNAKNTFSKYGIGALDKIRHVQEDANGKIWIATTDGLKIFDPDNLSGNSYPSKSFRKIAGDPTSLGNNSIQFIFKDAKSRMWVLTSGGGLNLAIGNDPFKSLKFKVYTTENGLPNDYLLNCVEDNNGNLWLATENGLSKFNPETGQFRNYDSYDGIPKSGFSEASGVRMPNGNLVIGCLNGYLAFNPNAIINHKIDENMALTNLQINNQDVSPTEKDSPLAIGINHAREITLKYNQNIISIDYTILDFRSGNKQVYAYRLQGFDTVWHTNKYQHRATYTNLPPGKYTFEVKSLSNDLYANRPSKRIAITILPPLWRTLWAYLLYVIIAGLLIAVIRRTAFTMLRLRNRISVERKLADLKLSFFTNISHELRTPLTLILNPIEEIYQQEKLSVQGQKYINVVRKNANRMVRFINQLLDLGKVQSGKAILVLSHVEIISFVKDIAGYFTEIAYEKHIELLITSNVTALYAWIDAEKIDIVLYNLLANAFKFSPNGKCIKIDISEDVNLQTFSIKVIDDGIGVSNDQLKDIFELYFEGDNIGHQLKGTGIGLALSRELINLHRGEIVAGNNPDGGLTVSIELKCGMEHFKTGEFTLADAGVPQIPLGQNAVQQTPLSEIAVAEELANAPLVLLVEDNYDLRRFLAIQLMGYYRIAEAENGEEGLEKAISLLPDLILSDVMMPLMSGIEMLDKLKNNELSSHIPVVLLTAKSAIENQIEGLKYGADGYITKPFQHDFLLATIDNILRQRRKLFESFMGHKKTIKLGPGEIIITSKDEVFLKEIIRIVENGMANPEFNIDRVAESIGMGRTTFYKKFKSLTNQAPVEFVREMRLKRGMQLLNAGEGNVSEIAYAVGFSSAGYFSTCFKEKYGMSPSEYFKNIISAKADKI